MTPEQILEKHLLIMLGRTEESYISIEEIKKQPEWQATINAMLEYTEHKALSQHDVIKNEVAVCRCHLSNTVMMCTVPGCEGRIC